MGVVFGQGVEHVLISASPSGEAAQEQFVSIAAGTPSFQLILVIFVLRTPPLQALPAFNSAETARVSRAAAAPATTGDCCRDCRCCQKKPDPHCPPVC